MIFRLRAYRPEDFDALYEIDQLCYEPEIAYSRRELRQYMRFPGAECMVAESERKLLGFCLAACEGRSGYIITMDVLQKYRRHGVGSALLQAIEQQLQSRGIAEIWLETATDNDAAIAFWQKHGYCKRSVRKGYYPGGRDAHSMCKRISGPAATH